MAQVDPRLAYDLFKTTNYIAAIPEFKKLLKIDPKDTKALFFLGQSYLNTNIDKSKAIEYLEKAIEYGSKEKDILYYLALAYTHVYNYEKSIKLIEDYKAQGGGKYSSEIPILIENFTKAKEIYAHPIPVTFENLGDKINSVYPDYYPFVSKDESVIVFTGRRNDGKGNIEFDGYYPSDMFMSKFDGFRFSPAKPITSLNTIYDESCVGIAHDGSVIYIYYDNYTNPNEQGDIYFAEKSGTSYAKKKKIPEGVNEPKTIETSFSISPEGNVMVFASNRNGNNTGLDLFMTRKLPNGKWAMAQPIAMLNTNGHEDFPIFDEDGVTLYFSSNGRGGLGGYDLFKSTWNPDENTWTEPENLGFPLNTSYDDRVISFAGNKKHAYVNQVLPEGYGDFDIYRVTFEEVEVNPALFKLLIVDESNSPVITDYFITVFNSMDEIVGEYKSNEGKMIPLVLPPGKYCIEIESDDFSLKQEAFKVSEFDYLKDNSKTIVLTK
jgi:hypothetical protein